MRFGSYTGLLASKSRRAELGLGDQGISLVDALLSVGQAGQMLSVDDVRKSSPCTYWAIPESKAVLNASNRERGRLDEKSDAIKPIRCRAPVFGKMSHHSKRKGLFGRLFRVNWDSWIIFEVRDRQYGYREAPTDRWHERSQRVSEYLCDEKGFARGDPKIRKRRSKRDHCFHGEGRKSRSWAQHRSARTSGTTTSSALSGLSPTSASDQDQHLSTLAENDLADLIARRVVYRVPSIRRRYA